MSKILGLGLPKTGLRSLGKSLEILGYTTVVSPHAFAKMTDSKAIMYANDKDALIGMLGYIDLDLLTSLYPDCKVIYTSRNRKSWVESVEKRFDDSFIDKSKEEEERKRLKEVFGVDKFDTQFFKNFWNAYEEYINGIRAIKNANFLDICISSNSDNDNWKLICEFLEKDIPVDVPFPKSKSNN